MRRSLAGGVLRNRPGAGAAPCRAPLYSTTWAAGGAGGPGAGGFGSELTMLLREWLALTCLQGLERATDRVELSLDFKAMVGEADYRSALAEAFKDKPLAPLTPPEIFAPHYSYAIGAYILAQHRRRAQSVSAGSTRGPRHSASALTEPLLIVEAGGGAGTNAQHVLDLVRERAPDVYARTRYTLVQPCATLAERARRRLEAARHARCATVVGGEEVVAWMASRRAPEPRPCFFIGVDLLGSLPHDKVLKRRLRPGAPSELCEAVITCSAAAAASATTTTGVAAEETYRPVSDPLLRRALELLLPEAATALAEPGGGGGGVLRAVLGLASSLTDLSWSHATWPAAFVPTGALQLLEALHRSFPQHRLVLADFDRLAPPVVSRAAARAYPDTISGARLAPLVSISDARTGAVTDYASYLMPPGAADVCFPTDFDRLKQMYCRVGGHRDTRVRVMKQSTFLQLQKLESAATQTRTSFNPMLDDFANYSVLLS